MPGAIRNAGIIQGRALYEEIRYLQLRSNEMLQDGETTIIYHCFHKFVLVFEKSEKYKSS